MNEVYERMSAIAGSTAESRASKILHGLGFDAKMQVCLVRPLGGGGAGGVRINTHQVSMHTTRDVDPRVSRAH